MRFNEPASAALLDQAIVLVLSVLPAVVLTLGLDASARWLLLGGMAWAIALPIKFVLSFPVQLVLLRSAEDGALPRTAARAKLAAVLLGAISACTELGVAAYIYHSNRDISSGLIDLLTFGFGAGCTEALLVVAMAILGKPTSAEQVEHWVECAKVSFWVRHVLFIERFGALAGQVGSRGLVCLAVEDATVWPAAFALVSFAATDGLAAYGSICNWDFFAPQVCRRFYVACSCISALEVVALALLSIAR